MGVLLNRLDFVCNFTVVANVWMNEALAFHSKGTRFNSSLQLIFYSSHLGRLGDFKAI